MAKILVLGGSGFIGLHLLEALQKEKDCSIIVYDLKKPQFSNYLGSFVKGDIKDFKKLSNEIKNNDIIIDLAGLLGTDETFNNVAEVAKVNIIGAINVFEAAKQYNKKVIYLSLTNQWLNPYTITKQTTNRFAQMYYHQYGTKIAVLRGLNVFGEYQKYHKVKKIIPQFIVNALLDKPLIIYGNGTQKVDLIDARDVARAIILAKNNDKAYGQTLDIGTGKAIKVIDVARLIIKLTDSKSCIVHKPPRRGEPINSLTVADNRMARLILGFKAQNSLEDGLLRTIEWYRKNLKNLKKI